ncbi:tetratricopeptide repeat protein [Marinitenerispora sediminis]|uniref:Co-chaperone YbbN n=1 Tax=Marinitenerispora sediminis TaxID=1931232 RepID=A0A368T8U7_9ACTN|nr:tetratricopeptide repeat protein [Marinitenerispora sediminis]RCV53260.1 co-chaperone YbbN [Marinitenerispora sediminis]RCV56141.1 co-chaperone YbbN [Marinitenerispora sediminis]RCV60872.1 co-chaperone YbbN [Marinitenerispora sediminis]
MQPSDFSMQSAVDLGARKAALEREAKRQAEASSGTANPYAIDITEENFQSEVLERSLRAPVVLAVLAAWSEQAKQVETALDRLAAQAGGQWFLAKIDTDATPQLAQALRAPTVPMVAMVIGGQVVPGPTGGATEPQLRDWLTQIFDGLRQQGVLPEDYTGFGPAPAEPEEAQPERSPVQEEAAAAIQRGDYAAAEAAYAKVLEADPGDEAAKVGLAQVRLVSRVRELDANAVRKTAAENPDDVDAQCKVADIDMYGGKFEDAFDRLVGTVRRTRDEDRDQARRHLLGLFEVLPPGDPRVAKARRALTSALF